MVEIWDHIIYILITPLVKWITSGAIYQQLVPALKLVNTWRLVQAFNRVLGTIFEVDTNFEIKFISAYIKKVVMVTFSEHFSAVSELY